MRTATVVILVGIALVASRVCEATEVYWVAAHDLVPQDYYGDTVASGDLDGDYDIDISFISGTPPARQYWNVGIQGSPVWELDTTTFDGVGFCTSRAGDLGDLDADGDLDVVTTCWDGSLHMYENVGTATEPAWEHRPGAFGEVHVGGAGSEPSLADIDGDGDNDLLVAAATGVIVLVENQGTPAVAVWADWVLIPGVRFGSSDYPVAALGDIDGDGDLDLVGTTGNTPAQCWENIGTSSSFVFVENPAMLTGVDAPPRGAGIELFDIDGDTDLDLFISPRLGSGNFLYLNEQIISVEPATWGVIKALYR